MTSTTYEIGGWSQSLTRAALPGFDPIIYGMVTNLEGLTTGTATSPGWSPSRAKAPRLDGHTGPVLWAYGGGLCSPKARPASDEEVQRIVDVTLANDWDGVDFDDECSMDIDRVTQAMEKLKQQGKRTSYGFIAGYTYNRPSTESGKILNGKVQQVIASGHCDRLVHYCYATRMWTDSEIEQFVGEALERSIAHGAGARQVILALTSSGLTDRNLELFLDQVTRLKIGGLYIWAYQNLSVAHKNTIYQRLGLQCSLENLPD
jgi:hypothetical protein